MYSDQEIKRLRSRWTPDIINRVKRSVKNRRVLTELLGRINGKSRQTGKGKNLDLRFIDLTSANLTAADLKDTSLDGACLKYANLENANLSGASLKRANLFDANLQCANLQGSDFHEANLQRANLRNTNLQGANLQSVRLDDANLEGAKLLLVNMQSVHLWGTNLRGTQFWGCNLESAVGISPELKVQVSIGSRSLLDIHLADGVSPENLSRLLAGLNQMHLNLCTQPLEIASIHLGMKIFEENYQPVAEGHVTMCGFNYILQLLASWLNAPEESLLSWCEAESKLSADIVSFLQEFAISNWLDLDNLIKTVDFYFNTGHSEDEIRRLTQQEADKFMATYHSVATLRRLAESGVIVGARIRKVRESRRAKPSARQ